MRNDDGSAIQAGHKSTSKERMEAFDRLPKTLRTAISNALLDYTPIDFWLAKCNGWTIPELLDTVRNANRRDHKLLTQQNKVARVDEVRLSDGDFQLRPRASVSRVTLIARRQVEHWSTRLGKAPGASARLGAVSRERIPPQISQKIGQSGAPPP